jgi:hypothetical protein
MAMTWCRHTILSSALNATTRRVRNAYFWRPKWKGNENMNSASKDTIKYFRRKNMALLS